MESSKTDGASSTAAELNYLNTVELLPGADNYLYDGDGSVALRPGMMTIGRGGAPQRLRFGSVQGSAKAKGHHHGVADFKRGCSSKCIEEPQGKSIWHLEVRMECMHTNPM